MKEEKDTSSLLKLETEIVTVLKSIFDPEIPVNIYDLGLIYNIDVNDTNDVIITMTLTAPNCPIADELLTEVENKVKFIEGVNSAKINLVFDPPWDKDMLTDEAKLDMGFF
jgi:FeS assembly SUF system protein